MTRRLLGREEKRGRVLLSGDRFAASAPVDNGRSRHHFRGRNRELFTNAPVPNWSSRFMVKGD